MLSIANKALSAFWKFLGTNDKQILLLFAAFGGVYTLIEYNSKRSSEEDTATSRFVELFGSSEIMRARIDFATFLNSQEIRRLTLDTYDNAMKEKIDDDKIFRNVAVQLAFFDSLSICVNSGKCSTATACQYFFRDTQAFIQNTKPIISELSRRYNEPTDRLLRSFAHGKCKEQHKNYCQIISFSGNDCLPYRPNY